MSKLMPWGSTYKVTADIGFAVGFEIAPIDGWTLDSATKGILDNALSFLYGPAVPVTDPTGGYATLDDPLCVLYGSGVGVDITEYVQEISINRGRQDQLQEFSAGTASIILYDQTRAFDPVNTASPFYDPITGSSGVTLRRIVKVFFEDTQIFTGRITDIDVEFQPTSTPISRSTVTLEVADQFTVLANTYIEEYTPTAQYGGSRIQTIVNLPEVAYVGDTDLDTGTILLDTEPIPDQTAVLDYFQAIAKTEQGFLFIKGDGTLRFSNRLGTFIISDPVFFADDGTGDLDYESLSVLYGQEQLFNRIICIPQGSETAFEANDNNSQTSYGISALVQDGLLCSDTAAQEMANYLLPLYKDPIYRFDSLTMRFAGAQVSTALQALIMALDLGSVIKVKKSFAVGTPTSLTQNLSLEGMTHTITPTYHEILFKTTPRTVAFAWTLDDATFGQLDSDNAVT